MISDDRFIAIIADEYMGHALIDLTDPNEFDSAHAVLNRYVHALGDDAHYYYWNGQRLGEVSVSLAHRIVNGYAQGQPPPL
jgi:hypothetical protein